MQRKLTITIDEDVYAALHRVVGRRKISGFIESLVRSHVIGDDCDLDYHNDVRVSSVDKSSGPDFITEGDGASHVPMTTEDHLKMIGQCQSIVELLAMPESADIDFEPLRLDRELYRKSELS